ncbi:hypothetical protein MYMAC_000423 [Corallococcus macrosporus DSM 14697]|uniref:Uncharacterized protein n=1 Tax=Corallococcus macrosporus DSM 14697 TaxID=1189310 RepID=A0A250JN70_9BACT|nr:hypothetical protein MYMAC_000423 [Corallococcus macrosporus DSM 14697]
MRDLSERLGQPLLHPCCCPGSEAVGTGNSGSLGGSPWATLNLRVTSLGFRLFPLRPLRVRPSDRT